MLEMAAVLIKQIYSIDINSCFTTVVPMWRRVPHLPGKIPMHCLGHATPRSPWLPLGVHQQCCREQEAKSSSEQWLCSLTFQKCWEIWKLTKNLISVSLINFTRATEVLTIAIKKNPLFHSRFQLNSSKKSHLQDLRLDQVPPTAQVTFYLD